MKRRTWVLAGAAVLVSVVATGAVVGSSADQAAPAVQEPPNTAQVKNGELSSVVSLDGTLTYRAQSDGSPYSAINQARGIYTKLPDEGAKVDCGEVFYRVDEHPVLLLCGAVPAYRDLGRGDKGNDVRQLNWNLHKLGYDVDPDVSVFTSKTAQALTKLQNDTSGELDLDDAVFLPTIGRISKVTGKLGGSAQPGAPVAQATSDTLEVQVQLEASQQGEVKVGDRAQITLPGNRSVTGKVERLGRVAQTTGQGDATIPAYLTLDKPAEARGLDRAPVQVDITTKGVASGMSVPVTALVGRSGGGFAVEIVRGDGRRELVTVQLGLFDTTNGQVEVTGDLAEGDLVVVPSL